MERNLTVVSLEFKKKNFIKNILISVTVLIPILFLCFIIDESIDISNIVLGTVPYMILVNGCFCLTQEFTNKTDKIIFTGVFKRYEIMISKLFNFFATSLIYFMFFQIVSILYNLFMSQNISQLISFTTVINNLYVFFIYTFTLGSFALLVSAVTSNSIFTGIITYAFYFDLIIALLSNVVESSSNKMVTILIEKLPFYIAVTGFNNLNYTFNQSIVMIVSGCIFFVIACAIINRKNI
ncbi:hypothetical protein [Clostridium sp. Marseille-Q7071]